MLSCEIDVDADPRVKDANGDDSESYAMKIAENALRKQWVAICKDAIELFGCFGIQTMHGRKLLYSFDDDMLVHISKTCHVTRATELRPDKGAKRVLKFMAERHQYDTEIRMRQQLENGSNVSDSHHFEGAVVPIAEKCILEQDQLEQQALICGQRTVKAKNIASYGCHVLAMERGERDVADIISHDFVAGVKLPEVRNIARSMAECLLALERSKQIHGDTKPRNAMEFRVDLDKAFSSIDDWLEDLQKYELLRVLTELGMTTMHQVQSMEHNTAQRVVDYAKANGVEISDALAEDLETRRRIKIRMIDLDASARFGEIAGLKWSTAFAPPELACLVYEYQTSDGYRSTKWVDFLASLPKERQVVASATFDVWSFGMVLYSLSAHEGAMPFLVSAADNIVRLEELYRLAYEWEEYKLKEVSKLVWPAAQDLVLWCLQTNPNRRPQSFDDVLKHQFFGGTVALRYLSGSQDTLADAAYRNAAKLHLEIERNNAGVVQQLLDLGSVHFKMIDNSRIDDLGSIAVSPLSRSAFFGDPSMVKVLLKEIVDSWPSEIRRKYLDQRTLLGFTAYMIACVCGHTLIAEMLAAKGCSIDLVSDLGKTGAQLLQDFHQEAKQRQLTPWRHGHGLWLGMGNAEQYLQCLESMNDSYFYHGVRVWNSKLLVAHFDFIQMKSLLDAMRCRLPKSQDLALHFCGVDVARQACLGCPGLRASEQGQLGGGLSVSLSLLDQLQWAKGGSFGAGDACFQFAMVVAGRLWGSKWYEVMPRDPPADLADRFIELPEHNFNPQPLTANELAAARSIDQNGKPVWGSHAKKLEAAFLVRIPSGAKRDPERIVPGRPDAYIVPKSDCVDFAQDDFMYYPTSNFEALFIACVPGNIDAAAPALDKLSCTGKLHRVQVTTEEADAGVSSHAIPAKACIADTVRAMKTKPQVLTYTAVAGPTSGLMSILECHHEAAAVHQVLWSESVARYTLNEMKAGLSGVEQLMPKSHVMAFYYTSMKEATRMCLGRKEHCLGGIEATARGIKVCLTSPTELGWCKNAGGDFRSNVAKLMKLQIADIEVMMVLQVPMIAGLHKVQSTFMIPAQLLTERDSVDEKLVYANAHIKKVYELGTTRAIAADH